MEITQQEIGQRLRQAREARGMTQEDVAQYLELSRPTIAQIELGNRAVTGLELSRLAHFFGCDMRQFVADEPVEESNALVALFRAHPEISGQRAVADAVRNSITLGIELTGIEEVLGIDRATAPATSYPLPTPRTKWDAIQQAERVASDERLRLGLGAAPVPELAQILESQGIRTALVKLPEDISGLTLADRGTGIFIVVNEDHHILRRRFSYAHEYAHVLLDRDLRGIVSRGEDREKLLEVRANAFAAAFLMPREGVLRFVHSLGKGLPSRRETSVFDHGEAIRARSRTAPGSQDVQLYDAVLLAHHFGVSRPAAIYRLRALDLINETRLGELLREEADDKGKRLAKALGLPEPDHQAAREEGRRRFVGLILEAYRRGEITRAKLREVADLLGMSPTQVDEAIDDLGLDDGEGVDAEIPET